MQVSSQDGDYPARLLAAAADRSALSQREQVADRGGPIVTRAEPALMTVARMVLASDWVERPRILLLAQGDACEVAILRQDGPIFCHRLSAAELSNGKGLVSAVEGLRELYLRQTQGQVHLDELVCMGAADQLDEWLAPLRDLNIRISLLDPAQWSQISVVEGLHDDGAQDSAPFAPVIAAALTELLGTRSLAELNLLPPAAAPTGFRLTSPCVLAPLALIVLSSVGLNIWDWHARAEASRLLRAVKNPSADMVACSELLRTESELKARAKHAHRLLSFIRDVDIRGFIDDLGRRLPEGLWLDRLAADTRENLVVEGLAQTEDALYSLIDSLRHSAYVDDVQMASTTATRLGQHVVNWFRIKVVLIVTDRPSAGGGKA